MIEILAAFGLAMRLIGEGSPELVRIVFLSLDVSLAAAVLACVLGLPLGAAVAVGRFPGRRAVIVAFNALLGLPSVVVGLLVYLMLSRAGPLGSLRRLIERATVEWASREVELTTPYGSDGESVVGAVHEQQ